MKKQTQQTETHAQQWYAHKLARVKMWREVRECIGYGLGTLLVFGAIVGAVIGICALIITAVETVDRSKKVPGLEAELAQVKSQCANHDWQLTSQGGRLMQLESRKSDSNTQQYNYQRQAYPPAWTNSWSDGVIWLTNMYITNSIIIR